MALKNNQQRRQYFNNEYNWKQVIRWNNFRIMRLEYRGEEFFRVDTYVYDQHFDFDEMKSTSYSEWERGFIKWHISADGMDTVSISQIIEILKEADKHDPKNNDVINNIIEHDEQHDGIKTKIKVVQNADEITNVTNTGIMNIKM